uniref:Uncharacterized protein n=1 Tax=Anguilla anguilla TaxID=7936 RepID=A0A0E9WZ51_ANGAN
MTPFFSFTSSTGCEKLNVCRVSNQVPFEALNSDCITHRVNVTAAFVIARHCGKPLFPGQSPQAAVLSELIQF